MICARALVLSVALAAAVPVVAAAQVDPQRADAYFKEAAALCEHEGGRLWGVSLCGPMIVADPVTHSIATNQPTPSVSQPPTLGFANAAVSWGGERWSTFVWQLLPPGDAHARGRLMLHELFHRIQPQLGLLLAEGQNDHLDTLDGRYWLQLEWRALARALDPSATDRTDAVGDALAFRSARHAQFPSASENERLLVMNEGLAQYTGTVASAASRADAVADTLDQLANAPQNQTFVRTFAYPSGAAYGLLLDIWSPGWTRRIRASDDVAQLLMAAVKVRPTEHATVAAARYGSAELRAAEEERDAKQTARLADLRRRFVERPVLVMPAAANFSFATAGITAIPGAGTLYPNFRVTAEWGSLKSAAALLSSDRRTLTVPAPAVVESPTMLHGDDWMLTLAPGWIVRPGPRAGDLQVVREER